jgi:hypothetical protein
MVAAYPGPWSGEGAQPTDNANVLSAEEFLSLYEVLPDGRSLQLTPDSAVAPFLRWAQSFPQIAAKAPASHMLDYLLEQLVEARYENRPTPLAGTYRVVYRTARGDSSVFFARTEQHPTWAMRTKGTTTTSSDPRSGRPIIGHELLVSAARTVEALPSRRTGATVPEGYFALVDSAVARTDSGTVFAGSIDLEQVAALFAADSLTRNRLKEAGRHKSDLQTRLFRSGRTATPGRFLMTPDGGVRFEMVIYHDGAPVLTVHAERISRDHMGRQEP